MEGRREGKNLGFCGNMLKNSYGNLLLLLWNHYKFMLSKNNQVLIPVTQCLLFLLLLFNICYYYCFPLSALQNTFTSPPPPKKPSIHHQYLSLITIRSSKFIFLESLLPKVFFWGGGEEGVLTYFFFFHHFGPSSKSACVYVCLCVCWQHRELFKS